MHIYFIKKIRQSVALVWFGLRDGGILYSPTLIQRPTVDFPAFLETGGLDAFLYEAAQNFEVFSKIQDQK